MHCRADAPRSNPTRAILNFFFLKNWRDLDFYEQKFQETEKFHVRKVKCLLRATERNMSVWRMETSDDRPFRSHFFSLRPSLFSFLPLTWIISLFRSPRVALRKGLRLSILTSSHSPVHWKPILALGILFNTYNYCITAFWLLQLVERRSA